MAACEFCSVAGACPPPWGRRHPSIRASGSASTRRLLTTRGTRARGDLSLGELDTIAVDPQHWGAGIGRALMAHAQSVLQKSWSRAILWTPPQYERGHAFYRTTGRVPLERSRRDGTEVAFAREL